MSRNGSQFFITFGPASWLDGKHVVFGQVDQTDGSMDVVSALELLGSGSGAVKGEKPVITDCGELSESESGESKAS